MLSVVRIEVSNSCLILDFMLSYIGLIGYENCQTSISVVHIEVSDIGLNLLKFREYFDQFLL